MTLKEIIQKCSWEEVKPFVLKLITRHEDSIDLFECAFLDLQSREAENITTEYDKIVVSEDGGASRYIGETRCGLTDGAWNESLILDIEAPEMPEAKLLAHILWEMTYHGFCEEQINCYWENCLHRGNESEEETEVELTPKRGKNRKYGFSDEQGNIVIPCIYEKVSPFGEGLAIAVDKEKGRRKYIDSTGRVMLNIACDSATIFEYGIAFIRQQEKWGAINKEGNLVAPCIYDYYSSRYENKIFFVKDKKIISITSPTGAIKE
ncbi:MAG: WG repeat-containing protein [Prevotellaceae bacterium]|jgi:hypothetical protein|nr:WG repeat-containing protein [Prevotellaceae bacterium]